MPSPPIIGVPASADTGVYRGGQYGQDEPTHTTTVLAPATFVAPRQPAAVTPPGRGTVYGGQTGQPTSANADAPIDTSGSLTGLILSRGTSTGAATQRRAPRLTTVLVSVGAAIAFIAVIGVVVYVLAGDFLGALFGTLLGH